MSTLVSLLICILNTVIGRKCANYFIFCNLLNLGRKSWRKFPTECFLLFPGYCTVIVFLFSNGLL